MKKLSIEEKAKAYDEAFNVALETYQTQPMYKNWLEKMFPELKESEDERVMENIIATIHLYYGEPLEDEAKEMIAWLEKQGEQKSTWGEEDENMVNRLIAYFEDKESFTAEDDIVYANWLKSLKPQNRWKPSEEQMDMLKIAVSTSNSIVLDSLYNDLMKLKE